MKGFCTYVTGRIVPSSSVLVVFDSVASLFISAKISLEKSKILLGDAFLNQEHMEIFLKVRIFLSAASLQLRSFSKLKLYCINKKVFLFLISYLNQ